MKKLLCFLVLISLLATVSCKRIENYSKFNIAYAEDFEELNIENEINNGKEGFYGFTADLFSKTDGENELLAPFSSYTALAMVYNGAEGRTKEEMHEALRLSQSEINKFCLAGAKSIEKIEKTEVLNANSVWIKDSYSEFVKKDYLKTLSHYYSPQVFCLPFDNKIVKRVNNWVYNNTDWEIDKLLNKKPNDRSRMLIVNATSISGKWSDEVKKTFKNTFKNLSGEASDAEYIKGSSALYKTESAYAVRRYLKGGAFFTAIMPNGNYEDYKNAFSGEEISSILTQIDPRGSTYELPMFEKEFEFSLEEPLKKMGMTDAFSEITADFSGMTESAEGLYISSAEQKTKISLNKNGLKAAAAIKIDMGAKSAAPLEEPLHLVFNKPFIYMVCTPLGLPMFIGCVENL